MYLTVQPAVGTVDHDTNECGRDSFRPRRCDVDYSCGRRSIDMTPSGPPGATPPEQPQKSAAAIPEPVSEADPAAPPPVRRYGFPAGWWRALDNHPPPGLSRIWWRS